MAGRRCGESNMGFVSHAYRLFFFHMCFVLILFLGAVSVFCAQAGCNSERRERLPWDGRVRADPHRKEETGTSVCIERGGNAGLAGRPHVCVCGKEMSAAKTRCLSCFCLSISPFGQMRCASSERASSACSVRARLDHWRTSVWGLWHIRSWRIIMRKERRLDAVHSAKCILLGI